MKKNKYHPFEDKNHMIRCALQDAIQWEESRLDAGVCDMNDDGERQRTEERVKCYRAYANRYYQNFKTAHEAMVEMMDEEIKSGRAQMMTISEIQAAHKRAEKEKGRKTRNQKEKHKGRAIGGHARAEKLTPERRKEIAKNAAKKRWRTSDAD